MPWINQKFEINFFYMQDRWGVRTPLDRGLKMTIDLRVRFLKWPFTIFMIIISLVPFNARASMNVDSYIKNTRAGGNAAVAARYYLIGIEEGFEWSNVYIENNNTKKVFLYCQPRNLTLTDDQTIDIFNRFINENISKYLNKPVGIVLLTALENAFPC